MSVKKRCCVSSYAPVHTSYLQVRKGRMNGNSRSQIYAVTCAHFCLRRPYGLIKVTYTNGEKVYSIGTGFFFKLIIND